MGPDFLGRPIYVAHILPEQYALFRDGFKDDHRLPPKYEEWLQTTNQYRATLKASGAQSEAVSVDWDTFLLYARRLGMKPSYPLLTTYAIRQGLNAIERTRRKPAAGAVL